jgi:hypothetical protein
VVVAGLRRKETPIDERRVQRREAGEPAHLECVVAHPVVIEYEPRASGEQHLYIDIVPHADADLFREPLAQDRSMVVARDQIGAGRAFVGALAGGGADPSDAENDKMSAASDGAWKNQDWLDCLDRRKTRDARHHVGDVEKPLAMARAYAHLPEPTRHLLPHDFISEASQVGAVGDLESDPDGYRQ